MKTLNTIAVILVIIGGLNWGLVGLFDFNLVDSIFNDGLSKVVYALVGLSALYMLVTWPKMRRSSM